MNDPAPVERVVLKKEGVAESSPLAGSKTLLTDITPAMAKEWLKRNVRNRTVSKDVVTAYARDMVNGEWAETHQGIAFNDLDELIDGQHRLNAVILSGVTVKMRVTWGLKSQMGGKLMTTMDAVDRGRTRSVADQLRIQHAMPEGAMIAQVCHSLGTLCYGERTRRLSVGQTLEIYTAFRQEVDHVIQCRSKERGLRTAGVLAGFAFAGPAREMMSLYEELVSGERMKPAMGLLRAFLTSTEAQLLTRGTDRGLAELVLQAIWLAVEGEKPKALPPPPWRDGLDYFRKRHPLRVAKIAAIFKLPQ